MSRSLSYLRQGFLGLAFLGTLGFGVTQAFASQSPSRTARACPARDYEYVTATCNAYCNGPGYCATNGFCACGPLP